MLGYRMKLFLVVLALVAAAPDAGTAPEFAEKAEFFEAPDGSAWMIKNVGRTTWKNVRVLVNGGSYYLAVPSIAPGKAVTFGRQQLAGADGGIAPALLSVRSVELYTNYGLQRLLP